MPYSGVLEAADAAWEFETESHDDSGPTSGVALGDVSGEGTPDFMLLSYGGTNPSGGSGAAYVLFGESLF